VRPCDPLDAAADLPAEVLGQNALSAEVPTMTEERFIAR